MDGNTATAPKKCSLCGKTRPITQYFHIRTPTQQIFHGNVCFSCLGIEGKLFKRKHDKLAFARTMHALFQQDDDEGGSGGWDPEDRARALKLILSKDARVKDALAKHQKKQLAKKEHEDRVRAKKLGQEKAGKNKDEKRKPISSFLHKHHHTLSDKLKPTAGDFNLTDTGPTSRVEYSRSDSTTNTATTQSATESANYTQQPAAESPAPDVALSAQQEAQKSQATTAQDQASVERQKQANRLHGNQVSAQNQQQTNRYQQSGQTLSFLSPFGMSGTDIRNKATAARTGVTATYAQSMFDKANPKANPNAKAEKAEQAAEEDAAKLQQLYNSARNTWSH